MVITDEYMKALEALVLENTPPPDTNDEFKNTMIRIYQSDLNYTHKCELMFTHIVNSM